MLLPGGGKHGKSVRALVLANLVPLAGALFLGWNAGAVLILYSVENMVIGFFNLLKILTSQHEARGSTGITVNKKEVKKVTGSHRLFFAMFFSFHYGLFSFVHLMFIMFISSFFLGALSDYMALLTLPLGVLALFASHGLSFYKNFWKGPERKRASLGELMVLPYKRIVIVHLTIFATMFLVVPFGFVIALLNAGEWAGLGGMAARAFLNFIGVLPLVVIKTAVDVASHLNERKKGGFLPNIRH